MIFEVSANISQHQTLESCDSIGLNANLVDKKEKSFIFSIKKYHRNGLLEKKIMKKCEILNSGKWTREENTKFIRAGLKYGTNWKKVKFQYKI
jgi:hypothetical protein